MSCVQAATVDTRQQGMEVDVVSQSPQYANTPPARGLNLSTLHANARGRRQCTIGSGGEVYTGRVPVAIHGW